MIGPEEIRAKALRRYRDVLSSFIEGASLFPMEIPFAKAKPGEAAARWNELEAELAELRRESSALRPGRSYEIDWEERQDRLAGRRLFPVRIRFPDEASYLAFIGKKSEAERFRADFERITSTFPELRAWAAAKPTAIIERSGDWPRLVAVLAWLRDNPSSGLYLREVPAVEDTKFLERHKRLLWELLDLVASRASPQGDAEGATSFETRCGLKTPQPLVRVRLLDRGIALRRFSGLDDLALPLDRLMALDLPEIERVLVFENKTSFGDADVFLTAPAMAGTLAMFGSGYASAALARASWLAARRIGYWGDIDSHGLRILGTFRSAFPLAESLLMDEETFDFFEEYRSDAPSDEAPEPTGLHPDELGLFRRLVSLPRRNRLEQERIPLGYARQRLLAWAQAE